MSATAPLVLITGGMRRLGAAIAVKFAQLGYDIALSSHADGEPEAALAEILTAQNIRWHGFVSDLSIVSSCDQLIGDVAAHFGRVPDVLVNNAACFGQDGWTEMDAATLHSHFGLNLFAPVLLSKALVQAAGDGAQPAIIHILDQRITNPHGDQISYTLSKQALAASVRTLATAFGKRARVNGVAPGLVIATDDYSSAQIERLAAMMPLGALPEPSAVADAVGYLATACHVSGEIIAVDGGASLKSYDRDFMHL